MKRIVFFTVFLLFAFTNSCLAVSFIKEWSVTQEVITWDIAQSGKYIGLINDDTYQILNFQGSIVKQGKNIWNGDWIRVSDEMFLVGNGIDGVNRVYTYQGAMVNSQDCWSYSYFSPTGKYILFGWGEDHYAICTQDGHLLYDRIYFSPWEPLTFSPSERYIAAPYGGLYRVDNDQMVCVLAGNITYATFVGNDDYIILQITDLESNQTCWKMYNHNLQEVWTREDLNGKIFGHKSGYVIITDRMLTFCNMQNEVVAERSLTTLIQDVYIPTNRDFFFIYTSDKLHLFNFSGKNIAQIPHTFSDPVWINPAGDRLYTYKEVFLAKESKYGYGALTEVTITSYVIKY